MLLYVISLNINFIAPVEKTQINAKFFNAQFGAYAYLLSC